MLRCMSPEVAHSCRHRGRPPRQLSGAKLPLTAFGGGRPQLGDTPFASDNCYSGKEPLARVLWRACGPYRPQRPWFWRYLQVDARGAGSFRIRRTRRACRGSTCRRRAGVDRLLSEALRAFTARTMSCRFMVIPNESEAPQSGLIRGHLQPVEMPRHPHSWIQRGRGRACLDDTLAEGVVSVGRGGASARDVIDKDWTHPAIVPPQSAQASMMLGREHARRAK
jgi:hypothetical protein